MSFQSANSEDACSLSANSGYSRYGYVNAARQYGTPIKPSGVPKISCCCVTKGRLDLLAMSITMFLNQTWPNRELIIVTDGGGSTELQDFMKRYEILDDMVRFVILGGEHPLGFLRNVSLDMMRGDIYVQWDDDDMNMPDRLAVQLAYMLYEGRDYCCFSDQLHVFIEHDVIKVFWNDWGAPIPGTIMARYKPLKYAGIRYPEHMSREEDIEFYKDMNKAVLSGVGYMHSYMHHGSAQDYMNTCPYNHHIWLRDHRSLDAEAIETRMKHVKSSIKYFADCGLDKLCSGKPVEIWGRTSLMIRYHDIKSVT